MKLIDLNGAPKRQMALALARLEAEDGILANAELLDDATDGRRGHVIGITGPPGVGKSTAINLLAKAFREERRSVAILAIDPSSRRTGGALLGDRNRFDLDPDDQNLFVRSLAARSQLGGLAESAIGAVTLLGALFDMVIVETVGVGQSETDIADLADTVIVAVQPGSGDSLQFMKAGIMEIPDILVVTKADLGPAAERTARDMQMAARAKLTPTKQTTKVLKIAANQPFAQSGILELAAAACDHLVELQQSDGLLARRRRQIRLWQHRLVQSWFGRHGLAASENRLELERPFQSLAHLHQELMHAICSATQG